jgi:hypothetical protein
MPCQGNPKCYKSLSGFLVAEAVLPLPALELEYGLSPLVLLHYLFIYCFLIGPSRCTSSLWFLLSYILVIRFLQAI